MKKKYLAVLAAGMLTLGVAGQASASAITGGDAIDQASASSVLDIVFAIDTSGSMWDDIATLGSIAQTTIQDLECPDCDVFIRARFMGIKGTRGSIFNESVYNYVVGTGATPVTSHSEDNGPAVTDLVNHYNWNDDTTATQDYYKAVVTIGDEGTENGAPVDLSDWNAAYVANQAAINNNVMLFSWVTDDPYPGVVDLFQTMALGGTGGGHIFGYANGGYAQLGVTGNLQGDLENILCTAGGGGNNPVPEPATMLLFGTGLTGLIASRRRKAKK